MVGKMNNGARTKKYINRKNLIIESASTILNNKGIVGMTLTDVGDQFGMVPTGIAYYFSSKEELMAACFFRSIEIFENLIAEAARGSTIEERLTRFVFSYFELRKRIVLGEAERFVQFDDVRALGDEAVATAYVQMFRKTRQLFSPDTVHIAERAALNARTHLFLQQFLWVEAWLPKYDPEDYARIAEKVLDILLHGFVSGPGAWSPRRLMVPQQGSVGSDDARETFLVAATQLINEHGYLGTSVDNISARLDVTKGAFYHYIEAKDDLVAICFARTNNVIRRTQREAALLPTDGYNRLTSALISLVEHQLEGDVPLLRADTVSLPKTIRQSVMKEYERNAVSFGSMISDGQIDGSVRPLDVQIGAHMLNAAVNAIGELGFWLPSPPGNDAAENFVRPLFEGLTSDPTE